MSNAQTLVIPAAGALGDAIAALARAAAGTIRRVVLAHRQARAVEHLERLSDRALYDIGLHRSQIRSVVYGDRT